jgi:L-iditol 2-dehydrogenase
MKAALKTAEGTFEIADVQRPQIPNADWVLARIRVAGICGTDLRHWKNASPSWNTTSWPTNLLAKSWTSARR